MRQVLRATALLGSSSAVAIVIGLGTAKALAVLVGPDGVGELGLLQSLVTLAVTLFGLGIGVGVVRVGSAMAPVAGDFRAIARGGWIVTAAGVALAALVMIAFRRPLASLLLGPDRSPSDVVLMVAAVAFTIAAQLRVGLLNARQRVSALARLQVATSLVVAVATVISVAVAGRRGLGIAVVLGGLGSYLVAEFFAWRDRIGSGQGASPADSRRVAGALLRFGLPYTGSLVVGTGVQLVLPAMVLHALGTESVGYYRAAIGLSSGYLTILLTSMARDYYPRVAAAPDDHQFLSTLVNQQQRLVLLLGAPIILFLLAFAPVVVPIVYSRSFMPTVEVLQWILVGELFRFSSWTLAYVILARERSNVYFATEAVAGVLLLITSWLGTRALGLPGLGLAYLATYASYLAITFIVATRSFGRIWNPSNLLPLAAASAAALAIIALPAAGYAHHRLWFGSLVVGVAAIAAARTARREWRAA